MNPFEGLFYPRLEGLTIAEAQRAASELSAVATEAEFRVSALQGKEENLTAREELQNLIYALKNRISRYIAFVQFIEANQ